MQISTVSSSRPFPAGAIATIDLDTLEPHLPALRRHAETMAGSPASAEAYVEALLDIVATDGSSLSGASDNKLGLFKLYNRLYANLFSDGPRDLETLTPCRARQALSLIMAGGFSTAEVAEIMDVTAIEAEAMVRAGARAGSDNAMSFYAM